MSFLKSLTFIFTKFSFKDIPLISQYYCAIAFKVHADDNIVIVAHGTNLS
jgi:hypothetical protein